MTPRQLAQFATENLGSLRHESGQVLYSGVNTLRPGSVYLLGHNPGGQPGNTALMTVSQSLKELPTNKANSYLDSTWSGRDALQRRVLWLLAGLGFHPREVAASNLCFVRSPSAAGINMRKCADRCWPVHQEILKIVRPRLVLVYGNSGQSPYSYLSNKFKPGE